MIETWGERAQKQAFTEQISSAVIDQPYPPCVTPVAGLQPVSLKHLRLEIRHASHVLLARRVGKVVTNAIGATYGIEDPDGSVKMLIFDGFNYPGDDIIPADAILAIKHPYCKVDFRAMPRIKVSHPTDLVVLPPTDDMAPLDCFSGPLAIHDLKPTATAANGSCPSYARSAFKTTCQEVMKQRSRKAIRKWTADHPILSTPSSSFLSPKPSTSPTAPALSK